MLLISKLFSFAPDFSTMVSGRVSGIFTRRTYLFCVSLAIGRLINFALPIKSNILFNHKIFLAVWTANNATVCFLQNYFQVIWPVVVFYSISMMNKFVAS